MTELGTHFENYWRWAIYMENALKILFVDGETILADVILSRPNQILFWDAAHLSVEQGIASVKELSSFIVNGFDQHEASLWITVQSCYEELNSDRDQSLKESDKSFLETFISEWLWRKFEDLKQWMLETGASSIRRTTQVASHHHRRTFSILATIGAFSLQKIRLCMH